MNRIVLLTMHPFSSENQDCFNEQIKGIMSVRDTSGALVYSKATPDSQPYSFSYFGEEKQYSAKDYLDNLSANSGNIVGLPDINDLIIIETISLDYFLDIETNNFKENLINFIRNNAKIETNEKMINVFVETSFGSFSNPSRELRSTTFGLIEIFRKTRLPIDGSKVHISNVRELVFSEIYSSDIPSLEKPAKEKQHLSFLMKIQKLFSRVKLAKIHA